MNNKMVCVYFNSYSVEDTYVVVVSSNSTFVGRVRVWCNSITSWRERRYKCWCCWCCVFLHSNSWCCSS